MAEHEVKVDPMAKVITGVGALVLLVVVIYLIVALVGTVNKNTTRGPVMESVPTAAAPAASAPAAPAATPAAAAPAAGGAGDVAAGKALFATCSACHGANGEGAGIFPKLAGLSADKAADLLKKYRAGETVGANTAMMAPNAKALTDANITDLSAFIASLGGGGAAAPAAAGAAAPVAQGKGDAAAGKTLYATCAACHGANAEGQGMFPKLANLGADKIVDLLKKYRAGETVGANTAMMAPNAKALSDADIENLATYIAGIGGAAAPAAGAPAAAAAAPAVILDKDVLARGKAIFTTCALCHGTEEAKTSRLLSAPLLPGHPASAVTSLMKIYAEGKSVGPNSSFMWPVAAGLSEADTQAVAAYIGTLPVHGAAAPAVEPVKSAIPVAEDEPARRATLARGKAIFTTCALCHGTEEARTSRLLGAPLLPGHPASAVTSLMKIYAEGKSVGPNSHFMWPVAQGLSEADTWAVAAYIDTLKPVGSH